MYEFIKYEYATYKEVFKEVKLFRVRNLEDTTRQNLILIGFKNGENAAIVASEDISLEE